MTASINKFLAVTKHRRERQIAYNTEHNITPRSVSRAVEDSLSTYEATRAQAAGVLRDAEMNVDITDTISELETEMLKAAEDMQFEKAALLRDQIKELKRAIDGRSSKEAKGGKPASYGKRGRGKRS